MRAEVFRVAHLCVQAGGADNRFGRDASDVEARAAETIAFDERHLRPHFSRIEGSQKPRGAGADDYQVVFVNRLGIFPVGRVNILQFSLVIVIR